MIKQTNYRYIWEVRDNEMYEDGFYYEDETENFNGPYETLKEARKAFDWYCEHYL